jgi:hypothetical protein
MNRKVYVVIWLMGLPVAILIGFGRAVRTVWSWRYAWASRMQCRHCHTEIALVRGWQCGCGFTYVGSVLRLCPVCFRRPLMVRCEQCGMTWRIR